MFSLQPHFSKEFLMAILFHDRGMRRFSALLASQLLQRPAAAKAFSPDHTKSAPWLDRIGLAKVWPFVLVSVPNFRQKFSTGNWWTGNLSLQWSWLRSFPQRLGQWNLAQLLTFRRSPRSCCWFTQPDKLWLALKWLAHETLTIPRYNVNIYQPSPCTNINILCFLQKGDVKNVNFALSVGDWCLPHVFEHTCLILWERNVAMEPFIARFHCRLDLPSGKLTQLWKIIMFTGQTHIHGHFP